MPDIKDYYAILQVHHQAEPDVIEGAFKKLVKKYHPDVNPSGGAAQTMKEINTAYQVLSDPVKRREYHKKWLERHQPALKSDSKFCGQESTIAKARKVLETYFQSIVDKDFDGAYGLICEKDQTNIRPDEFKAWQNEVAKVFELKRFRCEAVKVTRNESLRGCLYPEVVEFQTATVETNIVMERVEQDRFVKKVVLDKGNWRVFLGYEGLQPYIDKFQQLAGLITAKTVIQDVAETRGKSDPLTGLFNLRGFLEQAEREAARQQRYANVFSMIRCELTFGAHFAKSGKMTDYIEQFGKMLTANLRQLDIIGRTDECCFTILLPETALEAALRVAAKIRQIFFTGGGILPKDEVKIHLGVVQIQSAQVIDMLRQADHYLNIAKQSGPNRIASSKGIN